MKRLFVAIAVAGVACWSLSSCGSKKEETKEEATEETHSEYEAPEAKVESVEEQIAAGQTLVDNSDCKTCHHSTNKIIGPSHTEVAQKYEFTKANVALLADKIIKGGSGNWGEIPMTPHVGITQAEAEKMAMYVLSLDGEKPKD